MSRQRTAVQQLVRQLADAVGPIYVVDDRGVILYCNPACAAWTGVAEDELIGQTCVYGPPDGATAGPAAAAARLCPPPDALAGTPSRGHVAAVNAQGRLLFRQAEFRPLATEALPLERSSDAQSATAAVLVLVDLVECPEPPVDRQASGIISSPLVWADGSSDDAASDQLHADLIRWRHRLAGRYALDRMIGGSPAAARVRAQVALAAAVGSTVLISGPAGSGKQHTAKAIHYRRPADSIGSLVPIACATLASDAVISTLQALARTSASDSGRRPTVLISDVDALLLEAQASVVQLLGSLSAYRLIATASSSASQLVAAGKLRADLAAALATLSIELVGLRERIEDLPLLAQGFLEETNAAGGRQVGGFTPEALDLLAAYAWPGNLDELADVVRQSYERAVEAQIGPRDLPRQIHLSADAAERPPRRVEPIDLGQLLAKIETELIERALAEAKGNKTRAAQLLGLTRPRLYRRLVQLGLEDDSPDN